MLQAVRSLYPGAFCIPLSLVFKLDNFYPYATHKAPTIYPVSGIWVVIQIKNINVCFE